jgi:hypothetical protein
VCADFPASDSLNFVNISLEFAGSSGGEWPYDMSMVGCETSGVFRDSGGRVQLLPYAGAWPSSWRTNNACLYVAEKNVTQYHVTGEGYYMWHLHHECVEHGHARALPRYSEAEGFEVSLRPHSPSFVHSDAGPTVMPSLWPMAAPSFFSTLPPAAMPTVRLTFAPTNAPSSMPTTKPSLSPTVFVFKCVHGGTISIRSVVTFSTKEVIGGLAAEDYEQPTRDAFVSVTANALPASPNQYLKIFGCHKQVITSSKTVQQILFLTFFLFPCPF